jgi:hypothetical protein
MRGACSMPVGDRAARLVGRAFVVLPDSGNGASGGRHRDAVRSDARMCSPDGLRIACRKRHRWLDCRGARLLQFNLLSLFPCLASPVHAGPGARPGTPLPKGAKPYRLFQGNHRLYVLVSPRGRLPSPCSRRRPPAAVCAGKHTAQSSAFCIGAIVDLSSGSSIDRARLSWGLYFWFLPALLAQPLLRAILIVEHTGCSQDRNGLTNTRTTLTSLPIRLLMWNMPYHAEHHLYPSIPFHQLPALHMRIRENLTHVAPGYVAANWSVFQSLWDAHPLTAQFDLRQ